MENLIIYTVTVFFATALILFYFFIIKPNSDAKNRIKQERKERLEADELLEQVPTWFLQRSCEERCYKDFSETQLMEETV